MQAEAVSTAVGRVWLHHEHALAGCDGLGFLLAKAASLFFRGVDFVAGEADNVCPLADDGGCFLVQLDDVAIVAVSQW